MLADAIRDAWPDAVRRPLILLGILADKDVRGIIEALVPVAAGFAATQSSSPRALPASDLAVLIEEITGTAPIVVRDSVVDALQACERDAPHGMIVTGSITTAGEARAMLRATSVTTIR